MDVNVGTGRGVLQEGPAARESEAIRYFGRVLGRDGYVAPLMKYCALQQLCFLG